MSPGSTAAEVLETCETYLSLLGKDLQHHGLKINVDCLTGNPAREIIRYAEEHQVDLIPMATHGSAKVAWLLGSIAKKVVIHTSRPVICFASYSWNFLKLKSTVKDFI